MDNELIEINKKIMPLLKEASLVTDNITKNKVFKKICDVISNYPAASDLQTIEEHGITKFWWKMNHQPYGVIIPWNL